MNWDLFQLHITTPTELRKHQSISLNPKQYPLIDKPSAYLNLSTSIWQDDTWKLGSELSYQHQNHRFLARPYWTEKGFADNPFIQWKYDKHNQAWSLGSIQASWLPAVAATPMYGGFYAYNFRPQQAQSQLYHKTLTLTAPANIRIYKNNQLIALKRLHAGVYELNNLQLIEQFSDIKIIIQYDDGHQETLTDQYFMNWEWLQGNTWGWAMAAGKDTTSEIKNLWFDIRYALNDDLTLGTWFATQKDNKGLAFLTRWRHGNTLFSTDIGITNHNLLTNGEVQYFFSSGTMRAYSHTSLTNQTNAGISLNAMGATLGMDISPNQSTQYLRYSNNFAQHWLAIAEVQKSTWHTTKSDLAFSLTIQWFPNQSLEASTQFSQEGSHLYAAWNQSYPMDRVSGAISYNQTKQQQNTIAELQYEHDRWGKARIEWSTASKLGLHGSAALAMVDGQWAWGKPIHSSFAITTIDHTHIQQPIHASINHETKTIQPTPLLSTLPSESNIQIQFDNSNLPIGWFIVPEFQHFQLPKAGGTYIAAHVQKNIAMMGKLVLPSGKAAKYKSLLIYTPNENTIRSISGATGTIFLENVTKGKHLITINAAGRQYIASFTVPHDAPSLWQAGTIQLLEQ